MLLDHRSITPCPALFSQPIPVPVFLGPPPLLSPPRIPFPIHALAWGWDPKLMPRGPYWSQAPPCNGSSSCEAGSRRHNGSSWLPLFEGRLPKSGIALRWGVRSCHSPNLESRHQLHKQSHLMFIQVRAHVCTLTLTHTHTHTHTHTWGISTGSHLSLSRHSGLPEECPSPWSLLLIGIELDNQ